MPLPVGFQFGVPVERSAIVGLLGHDGVVGHVELVGAAVTVDPRLAHATPRLHGRFPVGVGLDEYHARVVVRYLHRRHLGYVGILRNYPHVFIDVDGLDGRQA